MTSEEICAEIQSILASGKITSLRFPAKYLVGRRLMQYRDRVWLFPFGAPPKRPIQIYLNGILQTEGDAYTLKVLGTEKEHVVAAIWTEDIPGDWLVQANYPVSGAL